MAVQLSLLQDDSVPRAMRRKTPYTDAEIKAFDDGFEAAITVLRHELVNTCLIAGVDAGKIGPLVNSTAEALQDWIVYQQENDR